MPATPTPRRLTVLDDFFRCQHQQVQEERAVVSAEDQALCARHGANRLATLELISLRRKRNVLGKLIEDNPKTFALMCVAIYVSYTFWHWWLTSPDTAIVSAPLRDALRGIGW